MNFGYQTAQSLSTFEWTGITWTKDYVSGRLVWLLVGAFLFLVSVPMFQRSSLLSSPNTTSVRKTNADVVTDGLKHEPEGVETITIQPVESVRKHSFYDLFRSELKLMCRSVPLWWQRRDDFVSAFPVCASQLNVYIPDKMHETLNLKTSLGDLTSDQTLLAKNINVKAAEGDVVLNGCQGEVLKGTVEFGNITLQQLDASVDLQTEEGNVTVSPVKSFIYSTALL